MRCDWAQILFAETLFESFVDTSENLLVYFLKSLRTVLDLATKVIVTKTHNLLAVFLLLLL